MVSYRFFMVYLFYFSWNYESYYKFIEEIIVELKKDSWHYKIATEIGSLSITDIDGHYYSTDDQGNTQINIPICPYIRSVLLGVTLLTFIVLACGIILYSTGYTLGWLGLGIYNNSFSEPNPPFILIGIISIMSIIFSFIERLIKAIRWKIQVRKYQVEKEPVPSFISAVYKTFKEKFCFYITLK